LEIIAHKITLKVQNLVTYGIGILADMALVVAGILPLIIGAV